METQRPPLGILMLEGKMSVEPGLMKSEATFPYPVVRRVVEGSSTPRTAEDAAAMLPLYIETARQLEREGVGAITANCGLIALMQKELAETVKVPVVTSALLMVPALHLMMPGRRIGILTFFTDAVGERNYNASGWSSDEIPVALDGVGEFESWLAFLRTKEIPDAARGQLEADLVTVAKRMVERHPDIGVFVSECTMLPACLQAVRDALGLPVFDILTMLDFVVGGNWRPASSLAGALA